MGPADVITLAAGDARIADRQLLGLGFDAFGDHDAAGLLGDLLDLAHELQLHRILLDVRNFCRQLPHPSPANAQGVPAHRRPHQSCSFSPHARDLLLDGLLFWRACCSLMGAYRRAVDHQRFPFTIARETLIYLQTKRLK